MCVYLSLSLYIYIYRERERDRYAHTHTHTHMCRGAGPGGVFSIDGKTMELLRFICILVPINPYLRELKGDSNFLPFLFPASGAHAGSRQPPKAREGGSVYISTI